MANKPRGAQSALRLRVGSCHFSSNFAWQLHFSSPHTSVRKSQSFKKSGLFFLTFSDLCCQKVKTQVNQKKRIREKMDLSFDNLTLLLSSFILLTLLVFFSWQLLQFEFQLDSSILVSSFSQWHISFGHALGESLTGKNYVSLPFLLLLLLFTKD